MSRRIEFLAEFGRFIVPREDVVVIVPSLAQGSQRHSDVFRRADMPAKSLQYFIGSRIIKN